MAYVAVAVIGRAARTPQQADDVDLHVLPPSRNVGVAVESRLSVGPHLPLVHRPLWYAAFDDGPLLSFFLEARSPYYGVYQVMYLDTCPLRLISSPALSTLHRN